jgi:ABC-type sugar transport system permease subunit
VARANRMWSLIFLAVPVTVYLTIVVAPTAYSFFFIFTDWRGLGGGATFTGLDNYRRLATDTAFLNAFRNTALWTAAAVVLPTGIGLTLALVLDRARHLGRPLKSLYFFPVALSLVIVGQVWFWIYQPTSGLLNQLLRAVGLDALTRAWLADPDTALWAVMTAWSWQQIALAMILFLAGLSGIPSDVLEAGRVDGATRWQETRHLVLPMLRPASVIVVALTMINALRSFDIVYIMTQGGPFRSSDTLALVMYREAFRTYNMGYGSAVAVTIFLTTFLVVAVYFWRVRKLGEVYG